MLRTPVMITPLEILLQRDDFVPLYSTKITISMYFLIMISEYDELGIYMINYAR